MRAGFLSGSTNSYGEGGISGREARCRPPRRGRCGRVVTRERRATPHRCCRPTIKCHEGRGATIWDARRQATWSRGSFATARCPRSRTHAPRPRFPRPQLSSTWRASSRLTCAPLVPKTSSSTSMPTSRPTGRQAWAPRRTPRSRFAVTSTPPGRPTAVPCTRRSSSTRVAAWSSAAAATAPKSPSIPLQTRSSRTSLARTS